MYFCKDVRLLAARNYAITMRAKHHILLAVTAIITLASCTVDYYDPNYMQQMAREAFPVKDIDQNQLWETTSLVTATVTASQTERLYFYHGNPYSTLGNSYLLAAKVFAPGTSEIVFDAPSSLQTIFVARRTDEGLSEAVAATVVDGCIDVDFTPGAAKVSRKNMPRRAASYDASWVVDVQTDNTSYFPTSEPANAKPYTGGWSTDANQVYVINGSSANQVNIGNTADFYIKGDVTLYSLNINKPWGQQANTAHIYLLPNSTLHLPNGLYAAYDAVISVGAGATLDCSNRTIQFSNDLGTIYNAGTITSGNFYSSSPRQIYNFGTMNIGGECNLTNFQVMNKGTVTSASKLDLNNSTMFINEGTLSVSDKLRISNAETKLINRGRLTANSFSLEGSGFAANEAGGEVTITTTTSLSSYNSTWDNEGMWTTHDFSLTSLSKNWINACQLYVTGLFYSSLGDGEGGLSIDGGGYMECANANISNIRINLGSNAQFNCTGTATFGWSNPSYQGFYGVGDQDGIARFKKAVEANPGRANAMQYGGNLLVASDDHFAQKRDGGAGCNYNTLGNNVKFAAYSGGLTPIAASSCAPGLSPAPVNLPEEPQIFTYAFEDMTVIAGDYDFNDVVFTLSSPIDNKVTITLMAVGAAKTLSLCWKKSQGNTDNIETIFDNVHHALGVPEDQITNSFQDGHNQVEPVSIEIEVPEDFNLTEHGDFFIADSYGTVHLPRFTQGFMPGQAPYAICVPGKWLWPVEFKVVTEAYPAFSTWAQDATQDITWYDTPTVENIVDLYSK